MKKVKSILLSLVLVLTVSGCAANTSDDVANEEQKMTIVNDELVSTTDKITEEEVVNANAEKTNVELESKVVENSEDKESIQTDKNNTEELIQEDVADNSEAVGMATQTNAAYVDGAVTEEDFVVYVNDVLVKTGEDINTLVEQLGEPDDFVQARSCLYDGDDKVYTYGGISIYTYPNGAEDIVYLIELTGEEKLPSDVGLGSTIAEITQAYGDGYVEFGTMLAYDLSETASISFQIENDIITFIEIYNE